MAAAPEDLVTFLEKIYDQTRSAWTVRRHVSSVAYFYAVHGEASPTGSPVVDRFVRRIRDPSVPKVRPLTREILHRLNRYLYDGQNKTLRQWRNIWRINVAFRARLRWEEICCLKVGPT